MKKLKTFLGAFAVAALLGGMAVAAGPWNLSQGDRGETVFVDPNGVRAPAGDSGIIIEFTNLSDAWTRYVPVHRGGIITKMYVVPDRTVPNSGNPTVVTVSRMWSGYTDGSVWTAVNGLAVTVTGTGNAGAGNPGNVSSDTVGTSTFADKDNPTYRIDAGTSIAIKSDGTDADEIAGSLVIVIE